MADVEYDWIRINPIRANVPAGQLVEEYRTRGADGGPTHYLLSTDGVLTASMRAIDEGKPVELLLLTARGEKPNWDQERTLRELNDFLAKWNAAPVKDGVVLPESVKSAEGSGNRYRRGASPRDMSAMPAPREKAPVWPPYLDPGPFTGAPEQLRALAPHIINLRKGRLSDDGIASTDEKDLDIIVDTIVARSAQGYRLMLYAHGGLTDERYGLALAWAYHRWWLAHGIYPVFFVWETGGLETFWQIVDGEERRGRSLSRDIWDYTTDPAIELLGRQVGRLLWRGMKDSALLASEQGGGARLFAEKLMRKWTGPTEIFAIGHSAGSIFHAHFLPALCSGALRVKQLHLLAPAITNALFTQKLAPMFSSHIGEGVLFGLTREAERADNCAKVYHKSLLYLVSRAFEEEKETPILGMEDFQRSDPMVQQVFGDRRILSPTLTMAPVNSASASTTHGGFDNDPSTMESVLRRMLGLGDDVAVRPAYPDGEPRIARMIVEPNYYGMPPGVFRSAPVLSPELAPAAVSAGDPSQPPAPPVATVQTGGQKIALCIGNDAFPDGMRLYGCVNDAKIWAETFRLQGYDAQILTDARAGQIRSAIQGILARSRPGDSVMIHVSSHGSQVLDVDRDELKEKQFSDDKDEVLVAIDWQEGGLVIDDEWPMLLQGPRGVKLIRFHDFCHSGSTSRMALGIDRRRRRRSVSLPDSVAVKAFEAAPRRSRGYRLNGADLPYVTFCACRNDQSAMEEDGSGVFTRVATRILRGQGSNLSTQEVYEAILKEMNSPEQVPWLEGSTLYSAAPLFGLPS